ncbi:hypothetical protein ACJX0J_009108, partial [Zea mays]
LLHHIYLHIMLIVTLKPPFLYGFLPSFNNLTSCDLKLVIIHECTCVLFVLKGISSKVQEINYDSQPY